MSFNRPTLTELIDRAQADIDTRLTDAASALRRTLLNVIARLQAAIAHGLYGYLDYISKQIIYDTAEVEYLERWASIWGIIRKAAAPATGNIDITGTTGAILPAGALLQRSDGIQYQTNADVTLVAGAGTVSVTAVTGGANTEATAGATLSLVSPTAGINSSATVATGGLTGGADIETDDDLRARLIARIQQPPHGGALHDYVAWALEVPGVTRAWAFDNWLGLGTVGVLFVRDNDPTIYPDQTEIDAVFAHIDPLRPAGKSGLYIASPVPAAQDFTIAISPNDVATQTSVQNALTDFFKNQANVEDGNGSGTLLLSEIIQAISLSTSATFNIVSPTANITLNKGEIGELGAITWQTL